ncbi:response regulator [bacterium]|jgi:CheY-like chemotaxis protein|nr:response regulator [Pirellulales bacterium]NBP80548.1 response regulator [bacterium]
MDGFFAQLDARSGGRPAVLITDDDVALRETLRATLEPCGVDTVLAGDGLEALEIVKRGPVHLAVFDMHMPRLTGLDAMRQLRAMGLDLPCILISARLDERLRQAAGEADAFSLLPKPISRADLTTSVQQALQSRYRWTGPPR